MASKTALQSLSREQAMKAQPIATEVIDRVDMKDGGARLVVEVQPGRVAKFILRLPGSIKRTFELDATGLELFERCDGSRSVKVLITDFANQHKLDRHEAERAVTEYLKILIRKGLISMMVKRK